MIMLERIVKLRYCPVSRSPKRRTRAGESRRGTCAAERRSVIVVVPTAPQKTRASLLAIAKGYQARGGNVRLIETNRGTERYCEVRQRLAEGRR